MRACKRNKRLIKLVCTIFYIPTKYLLSIILSLLWLLFPAKFIANKPKASPVGIKHEIAVIDGVVDGDLNWEQNYSISVLCQ